MKRGENLRKHGMSGTPEHRGDWFGSGENCSEQRRHASASTSRKAASALIAKIPEPLARHIARVFHPGKVNV